MGVPKWTEGPWLFEPHGETHALYSRRDDTKHGLRLMNLADGDRNFIANANLIAAAPELYEALCDMVSDRDCLSKKTIEFAERALAKARGESCT